MNLDVALKATAVMGQIMVLLLLNLFLAVLQIQMIHGTNPPIPAVATVNDNIPMQYDFRSVYASMLQDWLGVKNEDLQQIMLKNFQNIPLLKTTTAIEDTPNNADNTLIENYPNPFTQIYQY